MSRERDVEKGQIENDIEKIDHEPSEEIETPTTPTHSNIALTKEPDITATSAPCANSEDILEIPRRGRSTSKATDSSSDSEQAPSQRWHDHQVPPHRDRSRAQSSARSVRRDPVKVPRSQRRGLLGRLTVIAEVTNPYDYSRKTKWTLTFVIAVAGAAAPMASSIVLPALVDIARYFDSTATVVNLSISLYMLSMSIFPLWWSSFSESLGRRTIYLASFTLYVIFSILGAVSTNVGMFVSFTRFHSICVTHDRKERQVLGMY